jgi:hypothetical protein
VTKIANMPPPASHADATAESWKNMTVEDMTVALPTPTLPMLGDMTAKPKPVTSERPTIVKPKRKRVLWRVALGTAHGRDTRDTKKHRKRIVHSNGNQ